jgi:hypothetical protein
MARGSDKHNPRIDDEMGRETEALQRGAPVEPRVEEFRQMEPSGDDEPETDARLSTPDPPPSEGTLTVAEIEARSDLARHLRPTIFPADREAITQSVRETGGPPQLVAQLRTLPARRTFDNVQDVWRALGGRDEERN